MAGAEDVYYYLTLLNENYEHPAMPEGAEDGIVKGMYLVQGGARGHAEGEARDLLGSGAILREVIAGAALLERDFGITPTSVAVTSFTELKREADDCERWNLLHPLEDARVPYVTQSCVAGRMPGGGLDRLHPRLCRADPRLMCRRATRFWAPTASAARTIAASCASSSRSIAISLRSRR